MRWRDLTELRCEVALEWEVRGGGGPRWLGSEGVDALEVAVKNQGLVQSSTRRLGIFWKS